MGLEGAPHQVEHLLPLVLVHVNDILPARLVSVVNEFPSTEVSLAAVAVKPRVVVHQGFPRLSSRFILDGRYLCFLLVCDVLKCSHDLVFGFHVLDQGVLPKFQEPFSFIFRSCDPPLEASVQFGVDELAHDYSQVDLLFLE